MQEVVSIVERADHLYLAGNLVLLQQVIDLTQALLASSLSRERLQIVVACPSQELVPAFSQQSLTPLVASANQALQFWSIAREIPHALVVTGDTAVRVTHSRVQSTLYDVALHTYVEWKNNESTEQWQILPDGSLQQVI